MKEFEALQSLNLVYILGGVFIILLFVLALKKLIGEVSIIIGKPIGWVKKKNIDTKKIEELDKKVNSLEEKLVKLTDIVIDDRAENMRYEILEVASGITTGRSYTFEQLKHTFHLYDKYEDFLKKHDRENSEVEASIKLINEEYFNKMKEVAEFSKKEKKEKKDETR